MNPCTLLLMFTATTLLVNSSNSVVAHADSASLSQECTDDFQKLMGCLTYATGQAPSPSKECCSSVKEIKESDAKCLCYIMQQTHNGSAQVKSLGIQESKLLQLPSSCQLQNTSISFCPKLLGIPAGSPEAAIFTSNSTAATTTTPSTATSSIPNSDAPKSRAFKSTTSNLYGALVAAILVFFYGFPAGYASNFIHSFGFLN